MLAKKGADKDSEALLWRTLMATLTIVEEEPNESGVVGFTASTRVSTRQFRILAEAFLHEAILGSPYDLFNRLFFVRSASRFFGSPVAPPRKSLNCGTYTVVKFCTAPLALAASFVATPVV